MEYNIIKFKVSFFSVIENNITFLGVIVTPMSGKTVAPPAPTSVSY